MKRSGACVPRNAERKSDPTNEGRSLGADYFETFRHELEARISSSLPAGLYLKAAYEWQQKQAEQGVTPLWAFCRLAKAHPALGQLEADEALAAVESWLSDQRRPPGVGAWKYSFPGTPGEEDARMEFVTIWEEVRYLPGHTPLSNAVEKAKRIRLKAPRFNIKGYSDFLSIAACLQLTMGKKHNILLPCDTLASELNVSAMTISRYRRMAVKDGLLKIVRPHSYERTTGKGNATEFRFALHRYPALKKYYERSDDE